MEKVTAKVTANVISVVTMMDADFQKCSLTFRDIAEMYMRENHPEIKGWTETHSCKYDTQKGDCVWTVKIYTDGEVSFTEQEQD